MEQALQQVYAIRVGLGLAERPAEGRPLTDVPPDLDQNFSRVRQALADTLESAALLGYFPTSWNSTPDQARADFYKQEHGNLDVILANLVRQVSGRQAGPNQAPGGASRSGPGPLNLRYCDIVSEIDGVVTSRTVNPGNNVTVGQSLMAVRSLTEIWINGNFKETQLAYLRIGQRVRCEVDMYGSRKEFEARITGFTMGTGQTLALLPPQNATGNFVKIVQRLPVRIELTDYDPDQISALRGPVSRPRTCYYQGAAATGPHAGDSLTTALRRNAAENADAATDFKLCTISGSTGSDLQSCRRTRSVRNRKWLASDLNAIWPDLAGGVAQAGGRSLARRRRGGRPHVHGGARHDHRQRRVALHRRRLSAAVIDSEWVITSYLAANATMLPISGWISARLGRRNYFLFSIAVFTIASGLCGMATSLGQIILFRVIQGLAGGGLQPSSQGVLLDAFPPEKQGTAQTMFGVAALLGARRRPDAGRLSRRSIRLAVDLLHQPPRGRAWPLLMCYFVVDDPDYLKNSEPNYGASL